MKLRRVKYMPKVLEPGILYFPEEFGAAAHLCACGCGQKIRTPITPTEWKLDEHEKGPSLHPSVGNWQQKCQSHYLILEGEIVWAGKLSEKQVFSGRRQEEIRREVYFSRPQPKHEGTFMRLWNWITGFLRK